MDKKLYLWTYQNNTKILYYIIRGDIMGKVVKLRKSGKSLIITIPMAICEMFGLKEGSLVEIEPFTSNSMQLKVK